REAGVADVGAVLDLNVEALGHLVGPEGSASTTGAGGPRPLGDDVGRRDAPVAVSVRHGRGGGRPAGAIPTRARPLTTSAGGSRRRDVAGQQAIGQVGQAADDISDGGDVVGRDARDDGAPVLALIDCPTGVNTQHRLAAPLAYGLLGVGL